MSFLLSGEQVAVRGPGFHGVDDQFGTVVEEQHDGLDSTASAMKIDHQRRSPLWGRGNNLLCPVRDRSARRPRRYWS